MRITTHSKYSSNILIALTILAFAGLRADAADGKGQPDDPSGILRKPIPQKVVVLTFDDACASHATIVAPLLKKYGFGATFYICEFGKNFDNKTYYMSWEQIRALDDMGFEVGNHTLTHPALAKKTLEECTKEAEAIEERCKAHGIAKPTTFCWPGYSLNKPFYAVLADKGYTFARGGGNRPYIPTKDDPFNTPSYSVQNSSLDEKGFFANAVKQATPGQVVILTFHGVPDLEHDWVTTDPKRFEQCMKYLKDNDYTVIAMRDLAKYIDVEKARRVETAK